MREDALRSILLVKAVEEADREGTLLPAADRAAATRDAVRERGESTAAADTALPAGLLPTRAADLLAARARLQRARLAARFPVVDTVLALGGGVRWVGALLLPVSLATGVSLSALDGTRRINVLAFPLLGLVLWNLCVYATLIVRWSLALARRTPASALLAHTLAQSVVARLRRIVSRAAAFNTPLAGALDRFLAEWLEAARPLLAARASRLLHLSAASVGLGLIAGLYFRGIALDYQAGWESTFLTAEQVRSGARGRLRARVEADRHRDSGPGAPRRDPVAERARRRERGAVDPPAGGVRAVVRRAAPARARLREHAPRMAPGAACPDTAHARPVLPEHLRWSGGAYRPGHRGVCRTPTSRRPGRRRQCGHLLPAALGEGMAVDERAPMRYGEEDVPPAPAGARRGDRRCRRPAVQPRGHAGRRKPRRT